MLKSQAIALLGGSVTAAAEAIGITPSAITQWPEELPPRLADRVLAALARKHLPPEMIGDVVDDASDRPSADEPEPERSGPSPTQNGPGHSGVTSNDKVPACDA